MGFIYEGTGVTKTPVIRITKETAEIAITLNKSFADLTNEVITVSIESAGKNTPLMTRMNLKEVIALSAFAESQPIQVQGAVFVATIPLGLESAIILQENDAILLQLEGLKSADTYSIMAIEDFEATHSYVEFETKTSLKGEQSKRFDIENAEFLCIKNFTTLNEVGLHVETDKGIIEKRFIPQELVLMSRQVQPILSFNTAGAVIEGFGDMVVLPVQAVSGITLYKDADKDAVNITLMKYSEMQRSGNKGLFGGKVAFPR